MSTYKEVVDAIAYAMLETCTHFCRSCGAVARPVSVDWYMCRDCHGRYFAPKTAELEAAWRLGGQVAVIVVLNEAEGLDLSAL